MTATRTAGSAAVCKAVVPRATLKKKVFRACAIKHAIVAANLPFCCCCAVISVYCSVRDWTRICYVIGFKNRPHVIGFVADLFFSTQESGFKNIRIRCGTRRMDGSRIRKGEVADLKISGHVWTVPNSLGKQQLNFRLARDRNQKHFLRPGHKICVRNKCCARGQTGKHLCRQQCVLVCQGL